MLNLLLLATPNIDPNATPVPDTVVTNTPDWMYNPIFISLLLAFLAFCGYKIYKRIKNAKSPGSGYINQ